MADGEEKAERKLTKMKDKRKKNTERPGRRKGHHREAVGHREQRGWHSATLGS